MKKPGIGDTGFFFSNSVIHEYARSYNERAMISFMISLVPA